MSFFPDDIVVNESSTPFSILKEAADELSNRATSIIAFVSPMELPDRRVFEFNLLHRRVKLRLVLFEVHLNCNEDYPVAIQPPDLTVPDFLRKTKFVPAVKSYLSGMTPMAMVEAALGPREGYEVTNTWVSSTPEEFRGQLKSLFAQERMIAKVISFQLLNEDAINVPEPSSASSTEAESADDGESHDTSGIAGEQTNE